MTALARSLARGQIDAANRLYGRADGWRRADAALRLLRERVPDLGPEATLLKAVAVNALYSTNVIAIVRVAEHIARVVARSDLESRGPDLVEELAAAPIGGAEKGPLRRHSFASKFAYFFVASDRFPILDVYAEKTVRWHLGSDAITDAAQRYVAFARNIARLRDAIGSAVTLAELDRYLLIAGQCREWNAKGERAVISSEMKGIFKRGGEDFQRLLPGQ